MLKKKTTQGLLNDDLRTYMINSSSGQIFFKLCTYKARHVSSRLTLSQTTNFGLFQTEGVCRRQFQVH